MADDVFNEDDEELVIVEPEEQSDEQPSEPDDSDDQDDDDDGDDERTGVSEDDSEDEIVDKNKKIREQRTKRRQLQKQAKERSQRELALLREQNAELMRRMQAIEGNTLTQQAQSIEQQYNAALYEAQQAETIIARAVEAGNGEDVAVAMRLRDEAKERAQQLAYAKQQAEQYAQQAVQPQADPRVVDYAKQWLDANPWYNPQGRDEESSITKAIDNSLAAEGWNPASEEYWHELTRRVAARIGGSDNATTRRGWNPASEEYWHELTRRVAARIGGSDNATTRREAAPRRKAPPTGNTREHAPASTKNEVVVTPERKQAMIEAGVWDDPVARNRYLKAYQAYDRENAAR